MDHHQSDNYISTSRGEKGKDLHNTEECSAHGPVNIIDGLLLKHMYVCIEQKTQLNAICKKFHLNTHSFKKEWK